MVWTLYQSHATVSIIQGTVLFPPVMQTLTKINQYRNDKLAFSIAVGSGRLPWGVARGWYR